MIILCTTVECEPGGNGVDETEDVNEDSPASDRTDCSKNPSDIEERLKDVDEGLGESEGEQKVASGTGSHYDDSDREERKAPTENWDVEEDDGDANMPLVQPTPFGDTWNQSGDESFASNPLKLTCSQGDAGASGWAAMFADKICEDKQQPVAQDRGDKDTSQIAQFDNVSVARNVDENAVHAVLHEGCDLTVTAGGTSTKGDNVKSFAPDLVTLKIEPQSPAASSPNVDCTLDTTVPCADEGDDSIYLPSNTLSESIQATDSFGNADEASGVSKPPFGITRSLHNDGEGASGAVGAEENWDDSSNVECDTVEDYRYFKPEGLIENDQQQRGKL